MLSVFVNVSELFIDKSMKILNKQSTAIFAKLLKMAKENEGHIKIENTKSYMPVCVEVIEEVEGLVKVSIAHYYEQNGDLMADPEMCFAVISSTDNMTVVPYSYRSSGLGFGRESVIFEGSKVTGVNLSMQSDQSYFANIWMKNIKAQQKI